LDVAVYAAGYHIVTNVALASITFILIGFFALSTAITLYTISRLIEKMNKPNAKDESVV